MLRFKILASVVPLMAAAVLARNGLGTDPHPCITFGETSAQLASVPWTAGRHVAFTNDPARATVRVQVTDDAASADFALGDDNTPAETESCEAHGAPRLVSISAQPETDGPVIYLSSEGPADYRIYVRSQTFSPRDAAALIVGASGINRRMHAASL